MAEDRFGRSRPTALCRSLYHNTASGGARGVQSGHRQAAVARSRQRVDRGAGRAAAGSSSQRRHVGAALSLELAGTEADFSEVPASQQAVRDGRALGIDGIDSDPRTVDRLRRVAVARPLRLLQRIACRLRGHRHVLEFVEGDHDS